MQLINFTSIYYFAMLVIQCQHLAILVNQIFESVTSPNNPFTFTPWNIQYSRKHVVLPKYEMLKAPQYSAKKGATQTKTGQERSIQNETSRTSLLNLTFYKNVKIMYTTKSELVSFSHLLSKKYKLFTQLLIGSLFPFFCQLK